MISRITEQIYIGDQMDAINEGVIKHYQFDAILNVNDRELPEEIELCRKYNIGYTYYPAYGKNQKQRMQNCAKSLAALIQINYQKILVHCEAGIDRAPFVVALYLSAAKSIPVTKAYNIIKYYRHQVMEHLEWI